MYKLSDKRIKQIIEMLNSPLAKKAIEADEKFEPSDLFTNEELVNVKWQDIPSLVEKIFNKSEYKYSIERQCFYKYDKLWKMVPNGEKTCVEEKIYSEAKADGVDTSQLNWAQIRKEFVMANNDFTRLSDVMVRTRYRKYLFPNGTLDYDQQTGDYVFHKDVFDSADEIRQEENPMFPFEFQENMDGIGNLFRVIYQWGVDLRQIIYMIAYIIFCDKDFLNIVFYLVGDGSNGKSMLLKMITKIFPAGTVTSLDISKLTGDKDGSEVLESAYANISGEINLDDFDTTFFKKMTGGDDISVNVKYEAGCRTFRPTAKNIVSSNYIARLKNTTHGDLRRILNIKFTKTFPPVLDFYKLNMEPYLPALFTFCLHLSKKIKSGGMYISKAYQAETVDAICSESNSAYQFIQQFDVVYDLNVVSPRGLKGIDERILYKKYRDWCTSVGQFPYRQMRFFKELGTILRVDTRVPDSKYQRYISYAQDE